MNTDGLIIKENAVGEYDRVVSVLTSDLGLIRAFANGARRIKSKKNSSTSLLCYSRLSIYKGKDTYNINDAEPIEIFFGLRESIEKISLAQYFCEICSVLGIEGEGENELLRLVLNSLHMLSENKRPINMVKPVFELRSAVISGYMPDITSCRKCGKFENDDVMFFDAENGALFCHGCCEKEYGKFALTKGVLAAMRHICYCDFQKLFSFSLPEEGLKMLNSITEQYLLQQTGIRFKTLDFYKSL